MSRANPMMKDGFVPLGGFTECAETYWSRYVPHYLLKGSFVERRRLLEQITADELIQLLPDYDLDAVMDGKW